ncbi:LytR/AlgR family response regulator transcription factor [Dyadobacter psychrotolerans]|uniref:Response regulator transcription factor n=1 Tax=Dyadobacter psychrotolerans TaxID=2541721 RepID=A0A4R5DIV4_9BACT|nr:LytTR family DNA-binding domain-containing protein [Dyadobacter psychrotolerans]TDE13879.1 response regulator transcription factor [Dyadobacter psychrotolerans]
MLRAILIDNEPDCVKLLSLQLKMFCPQIEVVAECSKSEEGLHAIRSQDPDVVFLDIEMPQMNGFELLESVGDLKFALIFVTAYDHFAVKAFRYSAIDYLLKPADTRELQEAVKKIENHKRTFRSQINYAKEQLTSTFLPEKIALPYQNGVTFVNLNDILYCEADDNYARFHLANGDKLLASKTLRDVQEILEERHFLRVHRQFIVNLNQIKKLVKGGSNYLIMSSGQSIPVARNQRERLMQRFGWL